VSVDIPLLEGRARWERVTEGWIDNTHEDAFTHTVRIVEPDAGVEVIAVALPSPTYEIREARARALSGHVDPAALAGVAKLAGVGMVSGLGRRLAEATGNGAGARLIRDAIVEVARLARQAAKTPRVDAERAMTRGAEGCWDLDRQGFADLPDSCFTYSDAARPLFRTRTVATPMTVDIYSPRPGQPRVFARTKVARFERLDGRVRMFHSMNDNVHGFELTFEIDAATGQIVRAESVTSRLPYAGICSEPQRKIESLRGETLDAGLGKRIQGHVGGVTGCAQLYDLTADLLKLASTPPAR
jgi:hypothetical protein